MNFKIQAWIPVAIALIASFFSLILGPILPAPIVVPLALLIGIGSLFTDYVEDFKFKDFVIVASVMFAVVTAYIIVVGYSFATIPLWKIAVSAILADLVSFGIGTLATSAYALGFFPGLILDVISSVAVLLIVAFLIPGIGGIVLGSLAAAGALIPGPIPFTTITFIILRVIFN